MGDLLEFVLTRADFDIVLAVLQLLLASGVFVGVGPEIKIKMEPEGVRLFLLSESRVVRVSV